MTETFHPDVKLMAIADEICDWEREDLILVNGEGTLVTWDGDEFNPRLRLEDAQLQEGWETAARPVVEKATFIVIDEECGEETVKLERNKVPYGFEEETFVLHMLNAFQHYRSAVGHNRLVSTMDKASDVM